MAKLDLTSCTSSFERLRTAGYLYVDKTEYLWNLVKHDGGMFFLSRPRRFGKSLTISTLKAIFQGKKELFKGLAIYDKPYDWKKYSIIHLDMADCDSNSADELKSYLHGLLQSIARRNNLVISGDSVSAQFRNLIEDLASSGNQVVILLDEYDKPILNNISNPNLPEIFKVLKSFYATIKKCDQYERFVFVTGVSKFSLVSIFSDLNNLQDISMNADYATMLGYTQSEFETNFSEWIADTEPMQELPHDEFLAKIKTWYDGYRFEETAESVYNPVSLANFFIKKGKFDNYWFDTGTPSFLFELIKHDKLNLGKVTQEPTSASVFKAFEIDHIPAVNLMLQTGYLTIKSSVIKREKTFFILDFPNREVSESFNSYLLSAYANKSQNETDSFCDLMTDAVISGNLQEFQHLMEAFFAGIPYDVHHKDEANFENTFLTIFRMLGFDIQAESRTSDGRIDAVIETDDNIYIFEFKLDDDDSALSQILEKEYFKPYLCSGKKITLIGVNFDTNTGKLRDWKTEEVTKQIVAAFFVWISINLFANHVPGRYGLVGITPASLFRANIVRTRRKAGISSGAIPAIRGKTAALAY